MTAKRSQYWRCSNVLRSPIGMRIALSVCSLVFALGPLGVSAVASVVYDNSHNLLDFYVGGFGPYEALADDITLGPGPRLLSSLEIYYHGSNFVGGETLTVSLHAMDGAPTTGSFGFSTPGTLLFSQTAIILDTQAVATFSDSTPSVVLPDHVGVVLSFNNVDFSSTGSDAGPLLADPPVIGSSFDDYWLLGFPNPSDPWSLFRFPNGDPPANFAMLINAVNAAAVPESSTLAIWSLLALSAASSWSRRRCTKYILCQRVTLAGSCLAVRCKCPSVPCRRP